MRCVKPAFDAVIANLVFTDFMKYYLTGLGAFVVWGFSSLAVKPLAAYASLDILFYRVVLAFAVLVMIGLFFRRNATAESYRHFLSLGREKRIRAVWLTFVGGLFLTSNWFFFIFLVNHISVKAASFSYLVCPIVTMVLASIFLDEKLANRQWAAVGLSVLGCWLLSLGHWEDVLYSLIVAFSYGAYLVSQRANRGFDSLVILTFHVLVALVFLGCLAFFTTFSVPAEPFFYQYMLVLVVALTVFPLALNLYALKGISSSNLGMLLYANPIINFMLAIWYFKEPVSGMQLVSYGLIIVSIVVFNLEVIMRPLRQGSELTSE